MKQGLTGACIRTATSTYLPPAAFRTTTTHHETKDSDMPSSTMEDEPQWKLPKEEPLPAKLNSVEVKTISWTKDGVKKSRDLWKWEFQIVDGEYEGLKAWGETEDRLTNHPDNKVRQWGETLSGTVYDLGDGIDTNDLLGLECLIMVDNTSRERSDGKGTFYDTPVTDVLPRDAVTEPGF